MPSGSGAVIVPHLPALATEIHDMQYELPHTLMWPSIVS
jgi:hypothetical protein